MNKWKSLVLYIKSTNKQIMKKINIILLALLTVLLIPQESYAQQESKSPTMVLKTNPMAALGGPIWVLIVPITGEYRLMYEIKTTAKQSAMVSGSYLGPSLILNLDQITSDTANIDGINTSGFRLQGAYKFYLSRDTEAPEGLYLAPHVSYAKATIESVANPADKAEAVKMNFSGLIGYQLISSGGFALDLYTGLGFKVIDWEFTGNSSDIFELGTDRAVPSVAFGVNFGYAF
jgi:hypothetical protein